MVGTASARQNLPPEIGCNSDIVNSYSFLKNKTLSMAYEMFIDFVTRESINGTKKKPQRCFVTQWQHHWSIRENLMVPKHAKEKCFTCVCKIYEYSEKKVTNKFKQKSKYLI